jgi:Flp pilus assembly protein TadG
MKQGRLVHPARRRRERGQVLVFTALTMAFFLGLVAPAVDVGL